MSCDTRLTRLTTELGSTADSWEAVVGVSHSTSCSRPAAMTSSGRPSSARMRAVATRCVSTGSPFLRTWPSWARAANAYAAATLLLLNTAKSACSCRRGPMSTDTVRSAMPAWPSGSTTSPCIGRTSRPSQVSDVQASPAITAPGALLKPSAHSVSSKGEVRQHGCLTWKVCWGCTAPNSSGLRAVGSVSRDAVSRLDLVCSLPGDRATLLLVSAGAEKPSTRRLGLAGTGGLADELLPDVAVEAAMEAKGVLLKLKDACCRWPPVSLDLRSLASGPSFTVWAAAKLLLSPPRLMGSEGLLAGGELPSRGEVKEDMPILRWSYS